MPSVHVIDLEFIKRLTSLVCNNKNPVKVIDYHLKPFANYRVGFLGNHQKLEVQIQGDNNEESEPEKLNFFIKSFASTNDNASFKEEHVFVQEAEFFNKVLPRLMEAVSASQIEPWTPKCYFASENIVVLENLSFQGFNMVSNKTFKGEILTSAVKAMARMHAASLLAEKKLGKPLNELYPEACTERIFTEVTKRNSLNTILNMVTEVGKKIGRIGRNIEQGYQLGFDYIMRHKHDERVICHGDAWSNNYLFDSTKPLPKCRMVDFQLVRYAPRMFDLAIIIYATTTLDIRKKEEKPAIEAYWKELCSTLDMCNPDMEKPTLENEIKTFDRARLIGMVNAMLTYPVILLNKDILIEYKDKPEEFDKNFMHRESNNRYVYELMEKDGNYAYRIKDLVRAFIDGCAKLDDNADQEAEQDR